MLCTNIFALSGSNTRVSVRAPGLASGGNRTMLLSGTRCRRNIRLGRKSHVSQKFENMKDAFLFVKIAVFWPGVLLSQHIRIFRVFGGARNTSKVHETRKNGSEISFQNIRNAFEIQSLRQANIFGADAFCGSKSIFRKDNFARNLSLSGEKYSKTRTSWKLLGPRDVRGCSED